MQMSSVAYHVSVKAFSFPICKTERAFNAIAVNRNRFDDVLESFESVFFFVSNEKKIIEKRHAQNQLKLVVIETTWIQTSTSTAYLTIECIFTL